MSPILVTAETTRKVVACLDELLVVEVGCNKGRFISYLGAPTPFVVNFVRSKFKFKTRTLKNITIFDSAKVESGQMIRVVYALALVCCDALAFEIAAGRCYWLELCEGSNE